MLVSPRFEQSASMGELPCEGGFTINQKIDFSINASQDIDFSQIQSIGSHWASTQTIYVDNSANGSTITITINGTLQTLVIPKNSCGYYPVLCNNPPKMNFNSAGGVVNVNFVNFFIAPIVWFP